MNDKLKCYTDENYKKLLRNFHNNSYRHALIIEADIVHKDKCRLFHYSDLLRKAGNWIVNTFLDNFYENILNSTGVL